MVATAKPDPVRRLLVSDPDTRGLYLRVMPSGRKSFTLVARNPNGKQVWVAVGDCELMDLEEARTVAKECVKRIKTGLIALPKAEEIKPRQTFEVVHDSFIVRHVDKQFLRSGGETKRIFRIYVLPHWKSLTFSEITRGDHTVTAAYKQVLAGIAAEADLPRAVQSALNGLSSLYRVKLLRASPQKL